jgi:hypothetical protein
MSDQHRLAWEPDYGFCAMKETANVELAEALEVVRRRVCAYNIGSSERDVRCDCKYGASTESRRSGEKTGCPELRELINRLLYRPASFDGPAWTSTESGASA